MWKCKKCGEELEDTFDACWQCGTPEDGTSPRLPASPIPAGASSNSAKNSNTRSFIAVVVLLGSVLAPVVFPRAHGSFSGYSAENGGLYHMLDTQVPPIAATCLGLLGGYIAGVMSWPRVRFSLPCMCGAVGTIIYSAWTFPAPECMLKLDMLTGIYSNNVSIPVTPLGVSGILILLGCIAGTSAPARPNKRIKLIARSPDGSECSYTLAQLRDEFLSGKITTDWVARTQDKTDFKPVTEYLYPPE